MKRLFAVSFFLIALCLFFPFNIYAAEKTVCVDQTIGSDTNDGSASAPFKTLTKALDCLGGDDDLTIILNNRYAFSAEDLTFEAPLKDDGTGTPRVTIKLASTGCFDVGGGDNSEITFFKDGTYVVTSKTQKSGTETERATYKTEGNKLVIIWSDGEVSNWTYSISGNKLTITRPSGRTNVFTRK